MNITQNLCSFVNTKIYPLALHIYHFNAFKVCCLFPKMYWRYIFVMKNDTQLSYYAVYAFIWKLIFPVCIINIVISPVAFAECVYYVYLSFLHFNVINQTTKSCNIHHSIKNMKHFRNKSLKVKNSYRILVIISEIRFISKFILLPQLSWYNQTMHWY